MIDFRYHLVSLVALFLALAGGIALGAGPLQDPVRGELSAATSDGDAQALQEELDSVERLNEFRARYDEGTASLVLGDRLAGTSVSMLVLPIRTVPMSVRSSPVSRSATTRSWPSGASSGGSPATTSAS